MSPHVFAFFPWPIGAGHTGRCLVAASALRAAGHTCVFAADPTGGMVSSAGFSVLECGAGRGRPVKMPASGYLAIPSLDAAYAGYGYYHAGRIARDVERDRHMIATAEPDVVVSHMQPTATIAARTAGRRTLSIADADFLTQGSWNWMPWLEDTPARVAFHPPSLPAFNQVLASLSLPAISDVSDLLWADATLVASTPRLDPVPPQKSSDRSVEHVGPLIWDPGAQSIATLLRRLDAAHRPRVYVTTGSGDVAARALGDAAVEAAHAYGWSLFLATGYAGDRIAPSSRHDVVVHEFGGLWPALAWADAVVCHGGHSTILAGLVAGRPMIVVPAMSENEANGRAMLNGAGFLLFHTDYDAASGTLRIVPRYERQDDNAYVDRERLRLAVEELRTDASYGECAAREADSLRDWVRNAPARVVAAAEAVAR